MESATVTLTGSKDKLNESTVPLLDDEEHHEKSGETPEKDSMEMKEKSSDSGSHTEKDDQAPEKTVSPAHTVKKSGISGIFLPRFQANA